MQQATNTSPSSLRCYGCGGVDFSPVGGKNGYSFLACADCRTAMVNPYPSDEQLAEFYSNYRMNDSYVARQNSKMRRSKGRVKRMMRHGAPGKRFLDIGCSVGYVTVAAHAYGLESFGVDVDATAIEIAKKSFPGQGNFECISIHDLAARGDTFDMAYMSEVIEHVNDPETFIASTAKLLKTGGLLYLTTPDAGHFGVPRDFVQWNMVTPPNHLTLFTRKGMMALLARHGLKTERFQWAFKPGMKIFARKI
ncbi:MAG: class I SAM-dependent methyltransferase [Alphaproteobacteria bacterium]